MRCLQYIVYQPVGILVAVALPQPLLDGDARIAAGEEPALVGEAAALQRKAEDDRRVVLLKLFLVVLILGRQRAEA